MNATEGQQQAHDVRFDGACPTCEGSLDARVTAKGVWGWCGTCRRLSRSFVVPGPSGAVLMHPAAAA